MLAWYRTYRTYRRVVGGGEFCLWMDKHVYTKQRGTRAAANPTWRCSKTNTEDFFLGSC